MNADLLVRVTEAAVAAVVEARRWVAGELVIVIESEVSDGFSFAIVAGSFEVLARRGFGRSAEVHAWIERVRDHAMGIPVLYSAPREPFAMRLFSRDGKVVAT